VRFSYWQKARPHFLRSSFWEGERLEHRCGYRVNQEENLHE